MYVQFQYIMFPWLTNSTSKLSKSYIGDGLL